MLSYALRHVSGKDESGNWIQGDLVRYQSFDEQPGELAPSKGVQWFREDVPVPPPPTPEQIREGKLSDIQMRGVRMAAARKALILSGHMPTVKTILNDMTGIEGELARESFEFEANCRMDDPLSLSLKTALGLTDTEYEDLFLRAYEL